jgi:hypothetical protein
MKKIAIVLAVFALALPLPALAAVTKDATNTRDAYAPFEELIQITPSNSTVYNPPLRGCIVEVAGDLAIETSKGDSSVIITVVAAQLVPAMITKVLATGTTATVICGR